MEAIKGKRVLIVDDVVSTGESMNALEKLVEKSGGLIAGKCAVLAKAMPRTVLMWSFSASSRSSSSKRPDRPCRMKETL